MYKYIYNVILETYGTNDSHVSESTHDDMVCQSKSVATFIGAASDKKLHNLQFPYLEFDGINFETMTYIWLNFHDLQLCHI